jgi:hypothetical protein
MKNSFIYLFLLVLVSLLAYGCAKETVEPQTTGSIKGRVQNDHTAKGVAFASITTNPGTNAITTDINGHFSLTNIPTGKYTISAKKHGYESNIVQVHVEKDKTTHAQILLAAEDNEPASNFIKAKVTSYFNTVHHDATANTDSTFVEVNYLVQNTSSDKSVSKYQVYFQINTSKTTFYAQIDGDSLGSGQESVGHLSKYTRKYQAKSVKVSKIWAPKGS